MKFWLTTTIDDAEAETMAPTLTPRDTAFVERFRDCLRAAHGCYRLAESPEDADAIVYFEPDFHKFRSYPRRLISQELIRAYPNKCFVVDSVDGPIGFLPGVYTSMPANQWDSKRYRAGVYIYQYNGLITLLADRRDTVKPNLLFSFRGSASHPIREAIFNAGLDSPDSPIQQTFQWFDHTEDVKRAYVEEMLNSKFVLCPRGWGTASIRMFEVMELGRVPVILSDQWVPPAGPAWPDLSIRVSESRLKQLPDILRRREADAEEMGRRARRAWEDWFSPQVRLTRTLQSIEDILITRPIDHDERVYQNQWLTWRFDWEHEWTPIQSLVRAVKQGTLVSKVKTKVLARPAPTTPGQSEKRSEEQS